MEILVDEILNDGVHRWSGSIDGKAWTLFCGNAAAALSHIPDESVHCIITSPPYYSLRDYGVDGQIGLEDTVNEYLSNADNINVEGFEQEIKEIYGISDLDSLHKDKIKAHDVAEELKDKIHTAYEEKEKEIGEQQLRELERVVMLKIVDDRWMDHIDAMDELKDGIGLQAYGQKDPVVQYRIEGFDMFEQMNLDIQTDVVKFLMNARKREGNVQRTSSIKITGEGLDNTVSNELGGKAPRTSGSNEPIVNNEPKVGRNDPCPCGSGKKFKNCCGK